MQSDSLNGILEQAAAEFIHGKVFDVDASFYGICKECLKKKKNKLDKIKITWYHEIVIITIINSRETKINNIFQKRKGDHYYG